ncbi:MAG: ARMT1-like domain-containing protein [Deferrisomatales bacterium]|nr:ARMT1-like domain-containing protein [Deferrisomatales bacterium]
MRPEVECGSCITQWIYHRAATGLVGRERLRLLEALLATMVENSGELPCMGQVSNRSTEAAFALAPAARGTYAEAKAASNRAAAELLPSASAYIEAGNTAGERFLRACSVAALANVAPLGVPTGPFAFDELQGLLQQGGPAPIVQGDVAAGLGARRVVYALDNAGEVGFDSLVIRLLKEAGAHVTLVVKEPEFFEDATLADAHFFSLEGLADQVVAVDGFLVPAEAQGAAAEALARCDLVISKGTGSFESLWGELGDTRGMFLLKVKCRPISRLLDVPVGNFLISAPPGGAPRHP